MTRVAVCVITCRRPESLARLLDGLAALSFREPPESLRVIVVDNDEDGSGQPTCAQHTLPWPLECHPEPRRGIPFARNTAIAHAADVDFVAFIDDDEVPAPNWLDELLRVQRTYDADVVAGPVLSDLGDDAPAWAVRGGFYERPRYATGAAIDNAFTGNVLLRTTTLAELGPAPFNEEMALMGGSDAYLSRQLTRRGARMVWADDAVVTETVPASRVEVAWLWRRAFRAGVSRAFTEHRLSRSVLERARVALAGPLHVGRGFARLPLAISGSHRAVAAARSACFGAGLVAGSLGFRYQEYERVHGR